TRLGTRSWRCFNCTSISENACRQRWRRLNRTLYVIISQRPTSTRSPRMTQPAVPIALSPFELPAACGRLSDLHVHYPRTCDEIEGPCIGWFTDRQDSCFRNV